MNKKATNRGSTPLEQKGAPRTFKIKSVRTAKSGLELIFKVTDFASLDTDFTLCFCKFEEYEEALDEAMAYVHDQYNYPTWPELLKPALTKDRQSKERLIPIVCSYHVMLALLDPAKKLQEILKGEQLFAPAKSVEVERTRKEYLDDMYQLLDPLNIIWILNTLDDWVILLTSEHYIKKASEHITKVCELGTASVPVPEERELQEALFVLNTVISVRLFAEACWKALAVPQKAKK